MLFFCIKIPQNPLLSIESIPVTWCCEKLKKFALNLKKIFNGSERRLTFLRGNIKLWLSINEGFLPEILYRLGEVDWNLVRQYLGTKHR